MRRARMLPIAWCCLPLAALFVGCTGAVTTPGGSASGVRPTVDSEVEPTTSLYATSDATGDNTAATAQPAGSAELAATGEGTPAGEKTGESAIAAGTPEGSGSVSPGVAANATPSGTSPPGASVPVGTTDAIAKSFQTPETDAAAAAILKTPRVPTPPKVLTAQERAERAAQPVLDLTFDDLRFDIAKDSKFDWSMTTEKMESLRGRRVRIRGWIHPSSAFSSQVRDFIFVRDNLECCFGPGAAVFDCLSVAMAPGKTAKFGVLPIAVEGTLELDPFDIDGVTRMLYRLDGGVTQ